MQALRCNLHRSDQYKRNFLQIKLITMLATQNSVFPRNFLEIKILRALNLWQPRRPLHIVSAMININFDNVT